MVRLARSPILIPIVFLIAGAGAAKAQPRQRDGQISDKRPPTASISGRITAEGNPLSGVVVTIERFSGGQEPKLLRDKSDAEGRFRLEGIPPGECYLRPHAYAFVLAESERNIPNSKRLVLGPGESVDGITIELIRGCVVTGRVVDERGQPVVGARVGLRRPRGEGEQYPDYVNPSLQSSDFGRTDDRGVYRIFGMPAGSFVVAATLFTAPQEDTAQYTVYYPNTTVESKARMIELIAGAEKQGVDIQLIPPVKTYKATGRLMDAASGKPIPGLYIECQRLDNDSEKTALEETSPEVRTTDENGEFIIVGLQPGAHRLTVGHHSPVEWYGEPVDFEIVTRDVGGIELRARRGASVSGVVIVEGAADRQILSRVRPTVQSMMIGENPDGPGSGSSALVGPDGKFQFSGMRAGEFVLSALVYPPNKRILVMSRVEIDGQPVRGPIRLEEDQQLSGVRIVMTYGSGVVRGQVKFRNGEAPKGFCFEVYTSREQDNVQGFTVFPYRAQVSAGGQYSLEDLPPGDYELMLLAKPCGAEKFPEILPVKHKVRIVNGTESNADFIVDLGGKKQEENQ
ncbi:MAG: MSCRAMM family protein [Blastocatellia bacterium]